MKRNVWEIAYIVWIVFVVGLMLFWPAKAAEDTERTENHTEEAEERTECVIEPKEEEVLEDYENENIEAALLAQATRLDDVTVTHYDPCVKCCGKTDGITATGVHVTPYYTVAVDPELIPLGSEVLVDYGDGEIHYYRAEDVGGGVKGKRLDLCVTDHTEALTLGVRQATVWVLPKED